MGEPIISATRGNDTRPGSNTEVWHIPREFTPSEPLCGVSLSGQFKRSKGVPNCRACQVRASLSGFYTSHHPVLRAAYLGLPIPAYSEKYCDHSQLYEADLAADKDGRLVLTTRGKTLAQDIIAPVGWYDPNTQLYHGRRALELNTLCGISCGHWDTRFEGFARLHDSVRKHGRRVITCVRCAIHATNP